MSNSLQQKLVSSANNVIKQSIITQSHPFVKIGSLIMRPSQSGNIALIEKQLVLSPTNTVPADGLRNGGTIYFKIEPDQTICHGIVLQFDVTESGGSNSIRPNASPFFINYIQFSTPDDQIIQRIEDDFLNLDIVSIFSQEKWSVIAAAIGYKQNYEPLDSIPANGKRTYYLPLIGSFFQSAQPYLNGVGPIKVKIVLNTSSKSVRSGSGTLSLSNVQMHLDTQELPAEGVLNQEANYKKGVTLFYPVTQRVSDNITMNASSSYSEKLQDLNSNVGYMYFIIRSSVTGSSVDHYTPLDNFQLVDQNGNGILSGSVTNAVYNRAIDWADRFPSDYAHYKNLYVISPSLSPLDFLNKGTSPGFLPFTGQEKLNFATLAGAVAGVLTVTPSGTAAAGTYKLWWKDPLSLEVAITGPIAYNASAATIESDLEALPNFRGSVTVSGPLTSAATFTFSGEDYAGLDIPADSLNVVDAGTTSVDFTTSLTTHGVRGHGSNGSYQLDLLAKKQGAIQAKAGKTTVVNV